MADRIVIMKDGHIQQVGTPAEVYHQPANMFVAGFIGAPSMNMLQGQISAGAVRLDQGGEVAPARGLEDGRKVMVGIRPDDLRPGPGDGVIGGTVTVREPLGPDTLIYVDVGSQEVIAKADGRIPPDTGAQVRLAAEPENIHVFDAESGVALF